MCPPSLLLQAPVTAWEGGGLSLPDTVKLVLDKLIAAGWSGAEACGVRKHSMGGLLVKVREDGWGGRVGVRDYGGGQVGGRGAVVGELDGSGNTD